MSDHDQSAEIEKMIAEESDPRIRVQLMMMHKLTGSVATIGITVADLDSKFARHASDESAIFNQIKGGWKVAAWVFGIAQAIFCYVYIDLHADVKELMEKNQQDRIEHASMNTRLDSVEKQLRARK